VKEKKNKITEELENKRIKKTDFLWRNSTGTLDRKIKKKKEPRCDNPGACLCLYIQQHTTE
jgi:hypothetical protein